MGLWTWLIPALPLLGFVTLALFRPASRRAQAAIGAGSVVGAALVAVGVAWRFAAAGEPARYELWTWMAVGDLSPGIALYVDALTVVMTLVVTVVGALIHVYAVGFMREDPGFGRFFAYMNLFVFSMLVLVLADNLLLLYLGWEGVGLCSYLLIGFWYTDPDNGRAARKAFVVTRVGDAAMALALFWLALAFGTLEIQPLMEAASGSWSVGATAPIAVSALLLAGAVGKSAQLPLQVWLPDAMAGPTPVSALIHAATMVTAGVYLIARTHVLFELAPAVLTLVAVVGAVTLLLAGFSALTQHDIKRILAYSTISQIGYMFLALGVGAWSAAIFHLMTHAFFKALLFLGAGALIVALDGEHDIHAMGGLRNKLPVTFWTFLVASAALAGFPLVTAGFYSKDLILAQSWLSATGGSPWLWTAGIVGAFITALYIFRPVFEVFFGDEVEVTGRRPGAVMTVPMGGLAVLSVVGGFVETPESLGHVTLFSGFLAGSVPAAELGHGTVSHAMLEGIAALVPLAGILFAYLLFYSRTDLPARWSRGSVGGAVADLWDGGWGFDRAYDVLIVRPYIWIARVNRADIFDRLIGGIAEAARALHRGLARTQSGRLRWYAAVLVAGAAVVISVTFL